MITVIVKVSDCLADAEKEDLKDTIFEKMLRGFKLRGKGDLQIMEINVCSSSSVTGKEAKAIILMDLGGKDDKDFYYKGIVEGSIKGRGFVLQSDIEMLNADAYVRMCL